MRIKLEVIALSLEDALAAEEGGADRIELIAAMEEGGLTPPIDLAERVAARTKLDVQVMVRPHGRSFAYAEPELERMAEDIRAIRRLGKPGIVLGCLTPDKRADSRALSRLLDEAGESNVTFHRAIDEAADLEQAYRELGAFPSIRRVLTSGGAPAAPEGAALIRRLRQLEAAMPGAPAVMAGSGLTIGTLPRFLAETGVREVHLGTGVRSLDGAGRSRVDPRKVAKVRELLDRMSARQRAYPNAP